MFIIFPKLETRFKTHYQNAYANALQNTFLEWMFLQPKPSDQPFHSPASFNVISIAGIHFAYISCCYVEETSALRSSIIATVVNRGVCGMKFEYITKVPYSLSIACCKIRHACNLKWHITLADNTQYLWRRYDIRGF